MHVQLFGARATKCPRLQTPCQEPTCPPEGCTSRDSRYTAERPGESHGTKPAAGVIQYNFSVKRAVSRICVHDDFCRQPYSGQYGQLEPQRKPCRVHWQHSLGHHYGRSRSSSFKRIQDQVDEFNQIQRLKDELASDDESDAATSHESTLFDAGQAAESQTARVSLLTSYPALSKEGILAMVPCRKIVDRHVSHFFNDFDFASCKHRKQSSTISLQLNIR